MEFSPPGNVLRVKVTISLSKPRAFCRATQGDAIESYDGGVERDIYITKDGILD
jgi:hypothetical protein